MIQTSPAKPDARFEPMTRMERKNIAAIMRSGSPEELENYVNIMMELRYCRGQMNGLDEGRQVALGVISRIGEKDTLPDRVGDAWSKINGIAERACGMPPAIDPTAHMGGMLGGGFDGGDADLDAIDQRAAIAHAPKPDIANAKVVYRGSGANRNRYQWETSLTPTREEVIEAQTRLGFSPAGYGGPFNLQTAKVDDCEYLTTWESDSSCD